ncbi:hypothetical protein LEP1GSC188_0778 [Leptospira weilii serovar Topaz str. LT2116]|uniref:Uncharacterized protein n=1 Tax=Leptospira weilii serovar Topaz str. LT2116 TaxID=1088540 RepID=M3G7T4_9LEPT|nr:hypothetical protein LEP1GSC188_0778 [Leptospira weilii serovar Topaz str. LT2116]
MHGFLLFEVQSETLIVSSKSVFEFEAGSYFLTTLLTLD